MASEGKGKKVKLNGEHFGKKQRGNSFLRHEETFPLRYSGSAKNGSLSIESPSFALIS